MKEQPELNEQGLEHVKLSSNSMITAWQISSTLLNMENFISFIGSFQQQSQKLHFLLPYVNKVKKLQQDKQTLNKNLNQVVRQENQEIHKNDKKNLDKKTSGNTNLDKQKCHKSRLVEMIKSLKKQNIQNSKKLDQIRQNIKTQKISQTKQVQNAKSSFQNNLKQLISQEMNQMENLISVNKKYYLYKQSDSIYSSFVNKYFQEKLSFHRDKYQQNKHENPIEKDTIINNLDSKLVSERSFSFSSSFQQIIAENYEQLGQIKCKILSLQDKKRQATVQNLLKQKTKPKSMLDQCSPNAQNNRNSGRKRKNEVKSKFFTIFSSKDNESEQYIDKDKIVLNSKIIELNMQQEQNLKLSIIQVKSQILQFCYHLDIAFKQNIADEILNYVDKIKSLTEQLKIVIKEIIQVILVVNIQKGEICLKTDDKIGNQKKAQAKGYLRQNSNIQFFMAIIKQKVQKRHLLFVKLLFDFRQSIKVLKCFIDNRLNEIQHSLLQITQQIDDSLKKNSDNPQMNCLLQSVKFHFQNMQLHTTSIIKLKISSLDKLFQSQIKKYAQIYSAEIFQTLMSHCQTFGKENQLLEDLQFNFQQIDCNQYGQFSQFVILQTKSLEHALFTSDYALEIFHSALKSPDSLNPDDQYCSNDSSNLKQRGLKLTDTLQHNNNSNATKQIKPAYKSDLFIQQTQPKQFHGRNQKQIHHLLFDFYETFLQKTTHILQNVNNRK